VQLVVDRPALVLDRGAGVGGEPSGVGEQFLAGPLTQQHGGGVDGQPLEAHGGEADRGVLDRPVGIEDDGGTGGGHRPVPDAALDLLVGAALAGADGEADLGEQFVLLAGGLVGPTVEVVDVDRPLARTRGDEHPGAEDVADGGEVLGRIGLPEGAADRAAVTDDGIGDDPLRVVDDGKQPADDLGGQQVRVPGERAHP
jgi:hypothetical protein